MGLGVLMSLVIVWMFLLMLRLSRTSPRRLLMTTTKDCLFEGVSSVILCKGGRFNFPTIAHFHDLMPKTA